MKEFAESTGSRTFEEMPTLPHESFLDERIAGVMQRADRIHFKLDNMTSFEDTMSKGILSGGRPSNWTAFEFRSIMENPDLAAKTTFYVHVDF